MKIRLPKKLIMILGGVLVLCGGSGAAAVFVGTDKLLGPSYLELNGLGCTALQTVKLNRDHRVWVRKYVVGDKPGDGMARIKTALRVARAVQEKEKADLVQVTMLDKAGPTDRADMRGRMIGAQVLYMPDPSKAPDGAAVQTYSAYYVDGPATAKGEFYGLRIDLPLEDVEALTAKLTDKTDCVDPVVAVPEGEQGAPSAHGDKKKPKPKPKGEHGEASAEGEAPAGEGHDAGAAEGKGAEGHDAGPAGDNGAAGKGAEDKVAAKESGGFFSSVTGMIFGSKPEAPAEAHGAEGAAAPAEGHAVSGDGQAATAADAADKPAAATAHQASATDQPPAAPAAQGTPEAEQKASAHNAAAAEPKPAASDRPAGQPTAPSQPAASSQTAAKGEAAATDPPKKEEGGLLSSITGMIFGSGETQKPAEPVAAASAETKPSDNPPQPKTAAEGGKRWSSQTAADAASSGEAPPAQHSEAAPPASDGSTAADAAGAAWLAKFRGQSTPAAVPAVADGAKPTH